MKYPVLIVTYNRPERLKDFLNKFGHLDREIYIGVDKYVKDEKLGSDYMNAYKTIEKKYRNNKNIKFMFSTHHLGGKYSTPHFTTQAFNLTEKLIIMDDDLLFNEDFLKYCDFCLDYFENDKNIYTIEGFNPTKYSSTDDIIFYTSYPLQLGWATWEDRWKKYTNDLSQEGYLTIFKNLVSKFRFDILSIIFWFVQLYKSEKNHVDGWDWYHFYNQFKNDSKSIIYNKNLVLHDGFGEESLNMHGKNNEIFKNMKLEKFKLDSEINRSLNKEFEKEIKNRYFGISLYGFLEKVKNFL